MKNRNMITTITTALLALGFAALCPAPKAFGVVPAPDGGYPGGNTAEGSSALLSRTTGLYNTAVGIYSILSVTDGNFNTGVGAGTLLINTADENTAIGAGALLSNTTGETNTANGTFALFSNTTGSDNTAIGDSALLNNTIGALNTAVGDSALFSNTDGAFNTAVGLGALFANTSSQENTAVGYRALGNNQPSNFNTAVGSNALLNTTGGYNTAIGKDALTTTSTGNANTAVGPLALATNTTGSGNTAVGFSTLSSNTTGSDNTALGPGAGGNITTASNVICIGASGANVNDSCYIGNIFNRSSPSGTAVFVNSDGKLGTTVSSQRFKDDIKSMDKASEAILALKPVTFHYKKDFDPTGIAQFGLVAEDVEKVNPDLVVCDKDGKPYSVRYDQVNAMLLNEFLKEHHKVQEQHKEIEALKTELKEQRNLIQKVSERVEMGKAAPQMVSNDQN
jgi:trimeric autotransporter adhesin